MNEKIEKALERLGFAIRDSVHARRYVFGMPLENANRNWAKDTEALAVLTEMAEDHEQNKGLIADLTRDVNEEHDRAEKVKAEVGRLGSLKILTLNELADMARRAKKAEAELGLAEGTIEEITNAWCLDKAELEKARPLIEAVMGAELPKEERAQLGSHFMWETDETRILGAALTYKEQHER